MTSILSITRTIFAKFEQVSLASDKKCSVEIGKMTLIKRACSFKSGLIWVNAVCPGISLGKYNIKTLENCNKMCATFELASCGQETPMRVFGNQ